MPPSHYERSESVLLSCGRVWRRGARTGYLGSVFARWIAKVREWRRLAAERRADMRAHGVYSSRHEAVYRRLQDEARSRPESTRVPTPTGEVWMSPIEFELYEAMRREGLAPVPQFCVEGYYVDFAFPDRRIAVEADGAAYHGGDRHERDGHRDWILRRRYGWTVLRFHGSTIYR